jgi:hypothetical protein
MAFHARGSRFFGRGESCFSLEKTAAPVENSVRANHL